MGTAYTSLQNGDWSSPYTWDPEGVPVLEDGDMVTINHVITSNAGEVTNLSLVGLGANGGILVNSTTVITNKSYALVLVGGDYVPVDPDAVSSLADGYGAVCELQGQLDAAVIMDPMYGTLDPAAVLDTAGGELSANVVSEVAGGNLQRLEVWEGNVDSLGTRVDCPAADALLGTEYGDPVNPIVGELVQAAGGSPSILVV